MAADTSTAISFLIHTMSTVQNHSRRKHDLTGMYNPSLSCWSLFWSYVGFVGMLIRWCIWPRQHRLYCNNDCTNGGSFHDRHTARPWSVVGSYDCPDIDCYCDLSKPQTTACFWCLCDNAQICPKCGEKGSPQWLGDTSHLGPSYLNEIDWHGCESSGYDD